MAMCWSIFSNIHHLYVVGSDEYLICVGAHRRHDSSHSLDPNSLVLSYNPDLDSDPYGEEGSLWSFNYFFYNKKMKRILFFTCRAIRFVHVCVGARSMFWCFKRNQCYRSSALDCSNRTATEEKEGDDLADQLDLDEGMDTHATPCEKQPSLPVPALRHTLSSLLPQFTHHSSVSHPRISQWLFEPIRPSTLIC